MNLNFFKWVIRNRSIKEIALRSSDVIVGWLIRPISLITHRSPDKWVIGNKTGWSDNSKYLRIFLEEDNKENFRIIWISKNKSGRDIVRKFGFEAYSKWSLKGVYHTLTAGVFFFSSDISDINYWTSGNAVKINMWHGVGLKKLGLKQSDLYNPKDIYTKVFTPFFYDKPTYFIGPSEMMSRHFADCYDLSDNQMLKVGYPRCDFLLADDLFFNKYLERYESKEMKDFINSLSIFDKIYIYMPTFRDDQHDFIRDSKINFHELDALFKSKNYMLLLKLHPATRSNSIDFSSFNNIKVVDKNLDIYPILRKTDVLITDYSSIYYDYILMGDKQIILFPFDYDSYINNSRDLAFDYMTYSPGVKAWTYEELYNIINEERSLTVNERDTIIKAFWGENYIDSYKSIKLAAISKVNK